MPTEIRCPSCSRLLKVPENLLGKMVRCPGCQNTFTAEADSPAAPPPVAPSPAEPRSSRRPTLEPEGDIQDRPPARRSRPAPPEEEYEEADNEPYDDEDDRPRRRRRGRRDEARSLVMGPAIALMVVSGLILLVSILSMVLNLIGVGVLGAAAAGNAGRGGPGQADVIAHGVGGVVGAIVGLCYGGIIFSGALQMARLSSYGHAMTACIVAMLPCNICCIFALPFGIWGLIMLNRPEVKDAFG